MRWFIRGVMAVVFGSAFYEVLFGTVTVAGFVLLCVFAGLGLGLDRYLDS